MAVALLLTLGCGARAQDSTPSQGAHLLQDRLVAAALGAARQSESTTLADQVALCEIPAPPFQEQRRAEAMRRRFEALGLQNARIDKVGNALGERPGTGHGPSVVVSAHLDTVFPEGTDVRVRQSGSVLKGPGIADDCRGLAVLLAIARAMDAGDISTSAPIVFAATVGEEGLGDLRGVKHLVLTELAGRIGRFVSIDGTGYGITHVAVGSYRFRVTFRGPGGHSYGSFGAANPAHALGRAIAGVANLEVPADPRTTFNVGRVGGGTSVNAIPSEAWMEADLRSVDPDRLRALEQDFLQAVNAALAAENARWGNRGLVTLEVNRVGDRPAGRTSEHAPIVETAVSVTRALGLPVSLHEGSTDANLPISLSIPAITIGGGGMGVGAHSLGETFDSADSWKGTERAVLLTIALAQ